MNPQDNPTVGVIGAAGHTGRFVVAELRRRGMTPIAIARNFEALAGAFREPGVVCRVASADDSQSLDEALAGARAVINCAGPFLETADGLAAAAVRAGIHYLDVSAEQSSTLAVLDKYDDAARKAGIAVIPAMGFFGGFADLLATAAMGEWESADAIDIMIGLDSWHPTRGTRITGAKNTARRMVIADGQLVPAVTPGSEVAWEFAGPLGRQRMIAVPFSEVILIARHLKTSELHTYLNSVALGDVRNPETPGPAAADATGRSAQRFTVDVAVHQEGMTRRISARGRDIYAFSAALICDVTARLLQGRFSDAGARAPGAILNAREVLSALGPENLKFEITEGGPAAGSRPVLL